MKVLRFFIKALVLIVMIDFILAVIGNHFRLNIGLFIGIINVVIFIIVYKWELANNDN